MNSETKSYFDDVTNISAMHFAVIGRADDHFYNSALQCQNIEQMLHAELQKKGYERILFYSPQNMIYFWDADSKKRTESINAPQEPVTKERMVKIGPLLHGIPKKETPVSENVPNRQKETYNLGKMDNRQALGWFDRCMERSNYKTAIIITNAESFIRNFPVVTLPGGSVQTIEARLVDTLIRWRNYSGYGYRSIVIWVFNNSEIYLLADSLKDNVLWARIFSPIFKEKNPEGTVINISTPDAGEIKNIINYHRIKYGLEVDYNFIDKASQMLEKKARGQILTKPLKNKGEDKLGAVKLENIMEEIKKDGGIKLENIEKLCGKLEKKSAIKRINELSGLNEIKKFANELEIKTGKKTKKINTEYYSRIEEKIVSEKVAQTNLHIVLTGNPGTGKTVVAKLLGELYRELGILPVGSVTKATRADLVGEYQGQTALKTRECIQDSIGGVLFIDEAYNIVNAENDSYGIEASTTLLEAMSDRMGEFAVIIAGYPDEIEKFLRTNPGYKERFITHIHIEDYSPEVLADIFKKFIEKKDEEEEDKESGLTISEELSEKFEGFIQRCYKDSDKKTWANARTVLNIAQKMKDTCIIQGATVVGIEHIPDEYVKYLKEEKEEPVMKISRKKLPGSQLNLPQNDFFKDSDKDKNEDIKKIEQAVLFIENKQTDGSVSYGTGFLITPNGYFITCNHVIRGAQEITATIRLNNNGSYAERYYKCELINTSEDYDIALLKVNDFGLPYLNLDADPYYEYNKGGKICLFGYPFGNITAQDCTYTEGTISSIRTENDIECINLDISGRCGNSGGAVIDIKTGKVIGVFKGSLTHGDEEINFMRPIKYFNTYFLS